MPGKEIKGRSPIANYRHGGRIGFKEGMGADKRPGPSRGSSPKTQPKKKKSIHTTIRQAVKDVVSEGGSPKLITKEARLDRISKKLGVISAEISQKGPKGHGAAKKSKK